MSKPLQYVVSLALMLTLSDAAFGQVCTSAEPPTMSCTVPRVVSGAIGHHIILMDVSTAIGNSDHCGITTGHNVWFEVTPVISGPMTITTCHPATRYDTVLEVYSDGDSNCDFMTPVACNDDDLVGDGCLSGCGSPNPRSSSVTVQAAAGTRYRFVVGSYSGTISGPNCQPCLGVRVTIGAPCGDPPYNLDSTLATEIPGEPGVYHERVDVTDAVKLANEPIPPCTGPEIGHSVWFKTTPARAGRLTATTCNSMTNYDTVLAIYQSGGDGVLLEVGCNDDDPRAACVNSCDPAPRAAAVTADVDPNQEYLIQVGAYNNNSAGCLSPLCLGLDVILEDICDIDLTPPEVALVTPPELSAGCVCPAAPIGGWAYDPDGTFDTWTLEYRAIGAEVWSPIGSGGEAPQPGTTLANWNAGGLSQGYYVLRLTARNICSRTSSAERVVWLDTGFDTVQAATSGGSIVGGTACLAGTVADNFCFSQYQAEYSPAGAGTWQPVDPSNPTYGAGVINGQLAAWNTTALPDGNYDLRIMGTTDCAETQSIIFPAAIDNTPPITLISAPGDCDSLSGTVQIVGTVDDANLTGWSLSFTGGGLNQWVPLSSGFAPVIGGLLAEWDVTGLPPCSYTLRLIASDAAAVHCTGETHNRSEFMVSVEVASPLECLADLNGDGLVNLIDFALLQISFGQPCP